MATRIGNLRFEAVREDGTALTDAEIGEALAEAFIDYLREDAGMPLVSVERDGVTLCRRGVWAHGATFAKALAELRRKESSK